MSNKWTPGPWSVSFYGGGYAVCKTFTDGKGTMTANVAECPWMADLESVTDDPGESEFNAHLIAAAPELAEALEGLILAMSNSEHKAITVARAALAKARGEP